MNPLEGLVYGYFNKMRLCLIYNFAQHYRASIFKLIDQEFDCDFVFGDSYLDVKKMDYSLLHGHVTEVHIKRFGSWYYQEDIQPLLRKTYDSYILLGESRSLSSWLFCIRARLFYPKKRVYFWSHGWYGKETSMEKLLKKILFKLPNGGIFLYGNYARELMIKEGFNPDKLFVIHNSLSYEKQIHVRNALSPLPIYEEHFHNNSLNLIFMGRLTSSKKLDMVLQALALLRGKGQMYNMTFIGGGEAKEDLETLTKKLRLQECVWHYGPCYDEQVLGEMIYNADLCISPGNVGLTAIHSLVFGTPVLTHDVFSRQGPEFEAIRNDETGAFFQYDNIDSLAERITLWFMKNGDRREEVRQACMKEIDDYWTPQFQIEVFKKVLLQ